MSDDDRDTRLRDARGIAQDAIAVARDATAALARAHELLRELRPIADAYMDEYATTRETQELMARIAAEIDP